MTGAGPVGLVAAQAALALGAAEITVTDVNPHRLKLAEELGATRHGRRVGLLSSRVRRRARRAARVHGASGGHDRRPVGRGAGRELGDWIKKNVSFPNCMVDRITPITTDAYRAREGQVRISRAQGADAPDDA